MGADGLPLFLPLRKAGKQEERRGGMKLEHEKLTGEIIGAAIEVHRELGPGFLESVYEIALDVEFRNRNMLFERQPSIPIVYKGVEVGIHRLDFFVADQIVVELKAIKELLAEHFAIVRSYLHATNRRHGLLLNFAKPTLEVKRVLAAQ
jgi:GxxExxY protein